MEMDTQKLAKRIRAHAVRMVHQAGASHIGSALSIADLLAVLYGEHLRIRVNEPQWEHRDRFLLSKGHAVTALYATLAESGFFPVQELDSYGMDGSRLIGHVSHHVPGIEFSTGSLGHALPVACGMALASKREQRPERFVVLLGDGELDEGSIWEAALFAPQHQLDNLTVIIDNNNIQSFGSVEQILNLAPLADKWKAFRWRIQEIDGHDHRQISQALASLPFSPGSPSVILAHTVKGKGVGFMENELAWHYKSPNAAQLEQAIREIEAN